MQDEIDAVTDARNPTPEHGARQSRTHPRASSHDEGGTTELHIWTNARVDGRGRQPSNGWPWKGCDTWTANRRGRTNRELNRQSPRAEQHAINATPRYFAREPGFPGLHDGGAPKQQAKTKPDRTTSTWEAERQLSAPPYIFLPSYLFIRSMPRSFQFSFFIFIFRNCARESLLKDHS